MVDVGKFLLDRLMTVLLSILFLVFLCLLFLLRCRLLLLCRLYFENFRMVALLYVLG